MELSQANQTFLLFYFVFLISLIGLAFFIKHNKKNTEISLVDAVQTSVLFVGIFTLLVFGASYYFVLSDSTPTRQPLKDALTITASFFGGFATLTTAYIALAMFIDWREQPKLQIAHEMLDTTREIEKLIYELRNQNPYYNHEVKDQDYYHIRDNIVDRIHNLNYLERKYLSLIKKRDFRVFELDPQTSYNSLHRLSTLISKTSSCYWVLKNCKENNEPTNTIEFENAHKLFTNSYFVGKIFYDDEGMYIQGEDIGNEILEEIKIIYTEIESLTKNLCTKALK